MRTSVEFKVTDSPVRLVSKSRRHPAAPAPVSPLRRLDRYIAASVLASIVHALRAMPPSCRLPLPYAVTRFREVLPGHLLAFNKKLSPLVPTPIYFYIFALNTLSIRSSYAWVLPILYFINMYLLNGSRFNNKRRPLREFAGGNVTLDT